MIKNSATNIAAAIDPDDLGNLRMGIMIDRANGKAFSIILNCENNRWAPLALNEYQVDCNDIGSICDAINNVSGDIIRWVDAPDSRIV